MNWDDEPAQHPESHGNSISIWLPARGVLVTRLVGHASAAITKYYIAAAQRAIVDCGNMLVFHDWSQLTSYDPESRELIRAFGKMNTDDRVIARHLVSSKILSMAIQTAGLVLRRNFESTANRDIFEGWLDTAILAANTRPGNRA